MDTGSCRSALSTHLWEETQVFNGHIFFRVFLLSFISGGAPYKETIYVLLRIIELNVILQST